MLVSSSVSFYTADLCKLRTPAGLLLVFLVLRLDAQTSGEFGFTAPSLTSSTSTIVASVRIPAGSPGGVISLFDGVTPAGSALAAGDITATPRPYTIEAITNSEDDVLPKSLTAQ